MRKGTPRYTEAAWSSCNEIGRVPRAAIRASRLAVHRRAAAASGGSPDARRASSVSRVSALADGSCWKGGMISLLMKGQSGSASSRLVVRWPLTMSTSHVPPREPPWRVLEPCTSGEVPARAASVIGSAAVGDDASARWPVGLPARRSSAAPFWAAAGAEPSPPPPSANPSASGGGANSIQRRWSSFAFGGSSWNFRGTRWYARSRGCTALMAPLSVF